MNKQQLEKMNHEELAEYALTLQFHLETEKENVRILGKVIDLFLIENTTIRDALKNIGGIINEKL